MKISVYNGQRGAGDAVPKTVGRRRWNVEQTVRVLLHNRLGPVIGEIFGHK